MTPLERARALDTCALSDALDTLDLRGATTGLRPLWPTVSPVAGHARTVLVADKNDHAAGAHIASPVVAAAEPNDVIVIANGGRRDVSCWGGILTLAAIRAGVRGVVVDGACRDVDETEDLTLPVYSRAVVPISARGRLVQQDMDIPVEVAGVTVGPGDLVVADNNGVVFVPANHIGEVVGLAERIARREAEMLAALRSGTSVVDVMHDSTFPALAGNGDA